MLRGQRIFVCREMRCKCHINGRKVKEDVLLQRRRRCQRCARREVIAVKIGYRLYTARLFTACGGVWWGGGRADSRQVVWWQCAGGGRAGVVLIRCRCYRLCCLQACRDVSLREPAQEALCVCRRLCLSRDAIDIFFFRAFNRATPPPISLCLYVARSIRDD